MYYPQPEREPGGCMETLLISRIVFGMLLVPFLMVFGAVFAVILTLIALSISPFLALGTIVACVGLIAGLGKWEAARVRRQMPDEPDDD